MIGNKNQFHILKWYQYTQHSTMSKVNLNEMFFEFFGCKFGAIFFNGMQAITLK